MLFSVNHVFAQTFFAENEGCDCVTRQTKCIDLMSSMYNHRDVVYNVLNLSLDQQKCVDIIDKKRNEDIKPYFEQYKEQKNKLAQMCEHNSSKISIKKQERCIKKLEKSMKNIGKEYDKEFKSVLNAEQRSKLNTIRKMEKKEVKHCIKNKVYYERDEKLSPFGIQKQENMLCPTHRKWHLFGFKHK